MRQPLPDIDNLYGYNSNNSLELWLALPISISMSSLLPRLPRAVVKTATYSVMHLTVAVSVAYALTGNLAIALGIGLIEPAVQTVAYMVHEDAWRRIGSRDKPHEGEPGPYNA